MIRDQSYTTAAAVEQCTVQVVHCVWESENQGSFGGGKGTNPSTHMYVEVRERESFPLSRSVVCPPRVLVCRELLLLLSRWRSTGVIFFGKEREQGVTVR